MAADDTSLTKYFRLWCENYQIVMAPGGVAGLVVSTSAEDVKEEERKEI